jgi:sodium-dependent dicarboxylate transporter 2/3/5
VAREVDEGPRSPRDAYFEDAKRRIGLIAGPLLFLFVLAWPAPGLSHEAHILLAVFVWTVAYWVTEALPVAVTALLSSVLAIVLGIAPAQKVLVAYADPVVFLFVGSFMLAEAMKSSELDRRLALGLLRREWATRSASRLMLAMGVVTCGLSLWMSNTATTAIMLPVGVGVLRALGEPLDGAPSRLTIGLLLMLTWSSSVAVGIPVGSPPNLIAIGMIRDLTDRRVTFFDWIAVAMPLTVAMLVLCWLLLIYLYRDAPRPAGDLRTYIAEERGRLGPWTRAQVNVLVVFLLAALLWMLPGVAAMVSSPSAPLPRFLETRLPESAVALSAAILLFLLPTNWKRGEFTITWRQAVRIDWGTILLFGGGLAMGKLMFDTGLARAIGDASMRLSGGQSLWALTAVAIVIGVVLSETSSNTASASMVIPIVIAVAQSAGLSAIPPVFGAALGASFGFMLPVSTPPNAIVYGSGLVPLREMIRSGIYLDVAGAILIWLGLRLLCPLFGVI